MFYIFQSGELIIKLKINRIKKRLELLSNKPLPYIPQAGRFFPRPYYELFGRFKSELYKAGLINGKTKEEIKEIQKQDGLREMEEMELLSDEEFEKKLIESFSKLGCKLIKK